MFVDVVDNVGDSERDQLSKMHPNMDIVGNTAYASPSLISSDSRSHLRPAPISSSSSLVVDAQRAAHIVLACRPFLHVFNNLYSIISTI